MDIHPDTPGADDPGYGRRLGLDVGTARIGVASSDSAAVLATPVETVKRETKLGGRDGNDIARLVKIVSEYRPVEIVVGLPRNLKNKGSSSVDHAIDIARRLEHAVAAAHIAANYRPVFRFADERLTTVLATQALHASGVNTKKGRGVIDQAAAVEILQCWLDGRRALIDSHSDDAAGLQ